MTIKLKHITSILNSEGDVLSILKNESDELFIMVRTNLGMAQIICTTNRFNIQLYLTSRITLKQLFLLSESEHYIIITGEKAEARFFEITDNIPKEISGIQYANRLFHLIPKSVRTEKTTDAILELLPQIDDGVKMVLDDDIKITKSQVQFFSEDSPIQVMQVESEAQNPTEFDYLSASLNSGNGKLLCRLAPELLKLFLTNSLTIQDFFKCQMDKEYFYSNENGIHKLFYTDGLQGLIDRLSFGNLTYFSLPPEFIIDSPMEVWDYYVMNIVISGHGVIPSEFEKEYPVELQIL